MQHFSRNGHQICNKIISIFGVEDWQVQTLCSITKDTYAEIDDFTEEWNYPGT